LRQTVMVLVLAVTHGFDVFRVGGHACRVEGKVLLLLPPPGLPLEEFELGALRDIPQ
jgi:hypothetical protein